MTKKLVERQMNNRERYLSHNFEYTDDEFESILNQDVANNNGVTVRLNKGIEERDDPRFDIKDTSEAQKILNGIEAFTLADFEFQEPQKTNSKNCPKCDRSSEKPKNVQDRGKSHLETWKSVACPRCDDRFSTVPDYKKHECRGRRTDHNKSGGSSKGSKA